MYESKAHSRPLFGGGEDLAGILRGIEARLGQLATDKAAGKTVSEADEQALERAAANVKGEIAAEQAAAAAGGGTAVALNPTPGAGMPSYDDLMNFYQRSQLEEAGKATAATITKTIEAQRALVGNQLGDVVQRELQKSGIVSANGGTNPIVDQAVQSVLGHLKSVNGGDRAVLPGAEQSLVKHVAQGGQVETIDRVEVGSHRGAEAIIKSKSFVQAYAAALAVKTGVADDGQRAFYMEQRAKAMALGTDSAGGFLVPEEFLDEIQELLTPYTVVRRAGVEEVPFDKSLAQHTVASEPTAYYQVLENSHTAPSEMTFGEVPLLTPKELTAFVPVSNRLLRATDAAERYVRRSMAKVMGLREDLSFLQGTGGAEPTGFRNMPGITTNPITLGAGSGRENGFYPNLMDLRRIRAKMRRQNPVNPRPVWFFHIDVLTNLETLTDSSGRPLLETSVLTVDESGSSGRIDGVPFFTTTQIPTNVAQGNDANTTYILLVNMEETLVGLGQAMEIEASAEASYTPDGGTTHVHMFQARQTGFRAGMIHDINHRRKAQVLIQYGVKLPA